MEVVHVLMSGAAEVVLSLATVLKVMHVKVTGVSRWEQKRGLARRWGDSG